MDTTMQNLLEAVKELFPRREEHDRSIVHGDKNKACKFRSGWAASFNLSWHNTPMGGRDLFCYLEYPGLAIRSLHLKEKKLPAKASFLTKQSFEEGLIPALESWITEKVAQDEYGGMPVLSYPHFLPV